MTKQGIVYVAGVILFGLAYYPLRSWIGNDLIFVVVAIGYVAFLRLIGWYWQRSSRMRGGGN